MVSFYISIHDPRLTNVSVTWAESYTKLLAFNQTQYDRVLGLDSDSTVLQLMDELFLLPPSPVAMPRAFWLPREDHILSSQIVLVQPSEMEFERVTKAIEAAGPGEYDMEIFNSLYGDNALIIPHRRYDLLTRVFWEDHRVSYLGNDVEEWDPDKVLEEAKFLHFSDWPMTKPWIPDYHKMDEVKPKCNEENKGCRAQIVWLGFFSDFAKRRQVMCHGQLVVDNADVSRKFVESPWLRGQVNGSELGTSSSEKMRAQEVEPGRF